jgi:hypothetical protein
LVATHAWVAAWRWLAADAHAAATRRAFVVALARAVSAQWDALAHAHEQEGARALLNVLEAARQLGADDAATAVALTEDASARFDRGEFFYDAMDAAGPPVAAGRRVPLWLWASVVAVWALWAALRVSGGLRGPDEPASETE